MKTRDSRIKTAKDFRRAGGTRSEYLLIASKATNDAAKEQGWRASETAMALADIAEIAEKIWGDSSAGSRKKGIR